MPKKGYRQTTKHKGKLSKSHRRKHTSPETEFKKGHMISQEIREKIGKALKGRKRLEFAKKISGKNHWNWKGGISSDKDEYYRQKRRNEPQFRLNRVMGTAIYKSIRNEKAGKKWESLVSYTLEDLMARLKCQFKKGMSFDNYGKWHIDHKKPKSLFNFKTPKDLGFQSCWCLANLQPLWEKDNLSKSNNYG